MAKKVAVLAVNPVNGFGLFQYLEAFFENGISYKVYAVAETKEIKTNSGIELVADDVIANLIGHEDDFDALVLSEQQGSLTFCSHEYVGRFQLKFLYVAFLGCSVTLPY